MRSGSMWRSTDERNPWKATRKEASTVFHHPTCDYDAPLIQAKAQCQELNKRQKYKIRSYPQGIYNNCWQGKKIIMSVKPAKKNSSIQYMQDAHSVGPTNSRRSKNYHGLSHQGS